MKPCEPQDVTAASTLRPIKITTQLPHVIVVNVAVREQGGWRGGWKMGMGRGEVQSVGSKGLRVGEICNYIYIF